ncbi:MAG TPA: hypothetical protein VIL46_01220, partial [Gemmataceae bacterium]
YYVWLAVIAAVNAAVAAYYYLRVAGVMYLRSAFRPFAEARSPALTATVLACVGVTLAFGVYPWPLWDAARWAVAAP